MPIHKRNIGKQLQKRIKMNSRCSTDVILMNYQQMSINEINQMSMTDRLNMLMVDDLII